jgi:hypothetical protein
MTKETLRMQFLSGVITENEYKAKLNEEGKTIRIFPNGADTERQPEVDFPIEKVDRVDLNYGRNDKYLKSCNINQYGLVPWGDRDVAKVLLTILDDNLPSEYSTFEDFKYAIDKYDRNLEPLEQALKSKGIRFYAELNS